MARWASCLGRLPDSAQRHSNGQQQGPARRSCAITVQWSSHVDSCRCPATDAAGVTLLSSCIAGAVPAHTTLVQQQGSPRRRLPLAALDVLHKVVQEHRPCTGCIIVAQVLVNAPSEIQHLQQPGPAVRSHSLQCCYRSASTPAAQYPDKCPARVSQPCCCRMHALQFCRRPASIPAALQSEKALSTDR